VLRFLSADWFEAARARLGGVEVAPASSCRIQFDADGERFLLVVENGRLVRFEAGDLDGSDVEVSFTLPDAARIWRRELRDDDAMRVMSVVAPVRDGTYTGPPCPADLLGRGELVGVPSIPDASLLVQYTFSDGPFGVVHHWLRFENGRLVSDGFGEVGSADVRVGVPYWAVPMVRSGECTIIDALEGGALQGELGPLGLLAGILESPEFHDAELATGRHGFALAVVGELWSNPVWTEALDQLAGETAVM
jgi:hypothetical protein